ncbi:DNA ligase [Pseudomonas phage vB_PpuP-Torve]
MTLLDFLFPVATVALSVACYSCYRVNKPLRQKAREEREAKAKKEADDIRQALAKEKRDDLRKSIFSDIEQALNDPHYTLADHRYGSSSRGGPRWKALHKLAVFLKAHDDVTTEVRNLNERVYSQGRTIRELQLQQKEILKALQMGQPVE